MPKVSEEYFEQKKKEILNAAYEVCLKKPLPSIVMQDITDKAGFSHGVIYKYYKSVDEIFTELFSQINNDVKTFFEEGWNKIIKNNTDWRTVIKLVFEMYKNQLLAADLSTLKIAAYSDIFALNNPQRVADISHRLEKDGINPYIYMKKPLKDYLGKVIKDESLNPSASIDTILQFIIVSVKGIQTDYTLSKNFSNGHYDNRYDPGDMYACLANSVINMIEGR